MILRIPGTLSIASPEGDVAQWETAKTERARGGLVVFFSPRCWGGQEGWQGTGSSFPMAPSVSGFFIFLRLPAKVPISSNCDVDFWSAV